DEFRDQDEVHDQDEVRDQVRRMTLGDNVKELEKAVTGIRETESEEGGDVNLFSVDQGKAIIDFLFSSLFQYYKAYEYLFHVRREDLVLSNETDFILIFCPLTAKPMLEPMVKKIRFPSHKICLCDLWEPSVAMQILATKASRVLKSTGKRKHYFKDRCQHRDGTGAGLQRPPCFRQPSSAAGESREAPATHGSLLQPILKFPVNCRRPLDGDIIFSTLVAIQMVIKPTSCCLRIPGTAPIYWQYVDWEADKTISCPNRNGNDCSQKPSKLKWEEIICKEMLPSKKQPHIIQVAAEEDGRCVCRAVSSSQEPPVGTLVGDASAGSWGGFVVFAYAGRRVAVRIAEQGCGTGLCSESSVCSQPGCCPWAGEVLLTHQPHDEIELDQPALSPSASATESQGTDQGDCLQEPCPGAESSEAVAGVTAEEEKSAVCEIPNEIIGNLEGSGHRAERAAGRVIAMCPAGRGPTAADDTQELCLGTRSLVNLCLFSPKCAGAAAASEELGRSQDSRDEPRCSHMLK
ncbi:hypothetical protein EK904_010346, partial [Melospiza melodia maxima]